MLDGERENGALPYHNDIDEAVTLLLHYYLSVIVVAISYRQRERVVNLSRLNLYVCIFFFAFAYLT